ncbi:hypothetical protein CEUSTIGMA_g2195.t1 [Chlamydomonas eustigma]|uniref:Rhodanese domain-containing protein n=1 Tax=Chlamydomonas eustigma TaxID=1157962 RepID=A0A250WV98_9CHLO|nr:hypothetical protein CEUSTIGMA_g2195.t1 [Chlamydomonas eustigma]|eukprot:GAX74748.1 hypothetical protein CEUSTIGMA_g2195.t1 [Chlamydomonas eustigma]
MALQQPLRACSRSQLKIQATAQPIHQKLHKSAPRWREASTIGTSIACLSQAAPAVAETDGVDTTIEALVGAVKTAGDAVKIGISALDSGVQILKQGYEVAAPVLEQGVKTVFPVVEKAIDAASPTLKAALPVLQDAEKAIEGSIKGAALDTVLDSASKAATVASPLASKAATFIGSNDPITLGEYALAAFVFLNVAPPLLGLIAGLTRGYAGEITAAQVLDALSEGSCVLVDVRSEKDKENSGIPDVPSSVSNKIIDFDFATIVDKKLRGALRDPNGLEATFTALQISALKRVNGSTKIILLDRFGSDARAVAKELARKGFGKVFTVQGGFDGRNGWVQSKLQIKPAAASSPAFMSFPLGTTRSGTRKALPAPKA